MSSALRAFLTKGQQPLRTLVPRCNISTATTKKAAETEAINVLRDGTNHRVSKWDKRFLVWTGKFARAEEIPPTVPMGMMGKTYSQIRIKVCNYMMLVAAVASIGFVYSGKEAAKRGETVQKMNLDWHKRINEEARKHID